MCRWGLGILGDGLVGQKMFAGSRVGAWVVGCLWHPTLRILFDLDVGLFLLGGIVVGGVVEGGAVGG